MNNPFRDERWDEFRILLCRLVHQGGRWVWLPPLPHGSFAKRGLPTLYAAWIQFARGLNQVGSIWLAMRPSAWSLATASGTLAIILTLFLCFRQGIWINPRPPELSLSNSAARLAAPHDDLGESGDLPDTTIREDFRPDERSSIPKRVRWEMETDLDSSIPDRPRDEDEISSIPGRKRASDSNLSHEFDRTHDAEDENFAEVARFESLPATLSRQSLERRNSLLAQDDWTVHRRSPTSSRPRLLNPNAAVAGLIPAPPIPVKEILDKIDPRDSVLSEFDLPVTVRARFTSLPTPDAPCTIEVALLNEANFTVHSASVRFRLSAADQLIEVVPPAFREEDHLVWLVSNLREFETRTFRVTVLAEDSVALRAEASVQLEAQVAAVTEISDTAPTPPPDEDFDKINPASAEEPEESEPEEEDPFDLDMQIEPAKEASTGNDVPTVFVIANRGANPLRDLLLTVRLPMELSHSQGRELEHRIDNLAPGASYRTKLTVRADAPGSAKLLASVSTETGLVSSASVVVPISTAVIQEANPEPEGAPVTTVIPAQVFPEACGVTTVILPAAGY